MTLTDKLYDYNSELEAEDRCEIAESIEELLVTMEGVRNIMLGMCCDVLIPPDQSTTLKFKAVEIQEVLDKYI